VLSGKIWEWTWLDNCWTPISLYLAFGGSEKGQNPQLTSKREETYLTIARNLQDYFPPVLQVLSRRISIVVVQFAVTPDGDAPEALQAAQSLRLAYSND
jgi:hypothetical protein